MRDGTFQERARAAAEGESENRSEAASERRGVADDDECRVGRVSPAACHCSDTSSRPQLRKPSRSPLPILTYEIARWGR